jgi:hypothetical protein
MLEKLESPDSVLAVEVVGKLEKADYETVLIPAIDAQIKDAGEIRSVWVFGEKYQGLTAGAVSSDAKLYLGELFHRDLSKWKRCAVVTDKDWLRHSVEIFRFMMPGEVELFDVTQAQAAIEWAAA